jgi:hypothetical protein
VFEDLSVVVECCSRVPSEGVFVDVVAEALEDLAAVSGMPAYRLTAIETGKRVPQLFALYDLLVSMGYRMDAIERTWTYLRDLREHMGPARAPAPRDEATTRPVRHRAAR